LNVLTTVCGVNPSNLDAPRCPVCKEPGNRIKPETLRSMLKDSFLTKSLEDYSLCLSKDCDVAYFGKQVFYKGDIKVKIWFKEKDLFVPVCYCKGVTEANIIEHIAVHGCCKDIKDIQDHTGANTGKDCLTKNPAGT